MLPSDRGGNGGELACPRSHGHGLGSKMLITPGFPACSGCGFASLMASALEDVGGLSVSCCTACSFLLGVFGGSVPVLAGGTWELLSPGSRWGKVGQSSLNDRFGFCGGCRPSPGKSFCPDSLLSLCPQLLPTQVLGLSQVREVPIPGERSSEDL